MARQSLNHMQHRKTDCQCANTYLYLLFLSASCYSMECKVAFSTRMQIPSDVPQDIKADPHHTYSMAQFTVTLPKLGATDNTSMHCSLIQKVRYNYIQHLCILHSSCCCTQFLEGADPALLIWGKEVTADCQIGLLCQDRTEVCLL